MENAVKYNLPGGRVLVTLTADGGRVVPPGGGYRRGHPGGGSAQDLRPLLPGGQGPLPGRRRHRPGPVHRAGHGAPARRSRHCPAAGAGGHLLRGQLCPVERRGRWADETTHRGAGLSAGSGRRGLRPRPEEPEGRLLRVLLRPVRPLCPLPLLDCEPFEGERRRPHPCPGGRPAVPAGDPGPRLPPSPRGCAC